MSETTAELAVHLAAAAHQADAAALVDSAQFMARVAALGPDTPGFVDRVSAAVRQAVESGRPAEPEPTPEAVPLSYNEQLMRTAARQAQLTADYDGSITVEDVQLASPRVVGEWAAAGKLAHLGVPAQRRRGRR
ncbi:hypothetical protein P3T35_003039 [Kitasatospora sp. GP30]|uniref:hypothetical protein n=1 Tax=Kitasatospora sp. GP30 TaxID=3035084 RepID=UPI000C7052E2|nr:hypothetical protein [Kitasatospora sp. GP30]MDH6141026.1 hypothetical protein [Kitasatospora sp. GP30]